MVQMGTPEQYFGSVSVPQPIQGRIRQPVEARVIERRLETISLSWDDVLKAIALIGAIGIILYVFYITYKGK